MANENNQSSSFKDSMKSVGEFCLDFTWLLTAGCWAILDWVIRWNPISFVFWSLIAPEKMAKVLYNLEEPAVTAKLYVLKMGFALTRGLRNKLCKWHCCFLPLKAKRWFVLQNPKDFADDVQIAAYRSFVLKPDKAREILQNMPESTRLIFEKIAGPYETVELILLKKDPNKDDIAFLLRNQVECSVLEEIYEKNTPSQQMVNLLIQTLYKAHNDMCGGYLVKHASRDGLSATTLAMVGCISYATVRDKILKANQERGEVQLVKELKQSGSAGMQAWKKFLETNEELVADAEKEMSVEMMDLFYQTGHKLSDRNALYFLEGVGGYDAMIRKYRRLVMLNEKLSAEAMAYIKSNVAVYRQYLELQEETK